LTVLLGFANRGLRSGEIFESSAKADPTLRRTSSTIANLAIFRTTGREESFMTFSLNASSVP
jgi:hypothetical protein